MNWSQKVVDKLPQNPCYYNAPLSAIRSAFIPHDFMHKIFAMLD